MKKQNENSFSWEMLETPAANNKDEYVAVLYKDGKISQACSWNGKVKRVFNCPPELSQKKAAKRAEQVINEYPPYPVFDIDTEDCTTAHRIDSDTGTANEITAADVALAVPDAKVNTAHDIASGMPTARDVNDVGWCSIGSILSTLYPSKRNGKFAIMPCGSSN